MGPQWPGHSPTRETTGSPPGVLPGPPECGVEPTGDNHPDPVVGFPRLQPREAGKFTAAEPHQSPHAIAVTVEDGIHRCVHCETSGTDHGYTALRELWQSRHDRAPGGNARLYWLCGH
ncbi:hypothetical protein GCM10008995_19670 [Halobellus salinus]|uniref:Uncharacterized protein n=1 Tax=Halobellus salinus TaxID=931585 RepID=A0A830EBH8_9EURY|nr:hypothetical protein GCM10008995_19670 [Halobellus salinus]